MAEAAPEKASLPQQTECPTCRNTYDLDRRLPISLQCLHTLCEECIVKLAKTSPINCPICTKRTEVEKLITSLEMCNIVDKLCQMCSTRAELTKCDHCGMDMCPNCSEAHVQTLHDDMKQKLQLLRREVRTADRMLHDETALDNEKNKAEHTISEIRKTIQFHRDELSALEDRLKNKMYEVSNANIEQHANWQKKLANEAEKYQEFVEYSKRRLGDEYNTNECSMEEMMEINRQALTFEAELKRLQEQQPKQLEYKFVTKGKGLNRVGQIVCKPKSTPSSAAGNPQSSAKEDWTNIEDINTSSNLTEAVANRPRKVGYTGACFKAMTTTVEDHPETIGGESYVTSSNNRYFVSDTSNHRFLACTKSPGVHHIIGEEGSEDHQFKEPKAICCTPDTELFISDSGNNRIKVYDRYNQLTRIFGSKGDGNDEFDQPTGLALNSAGELLVCDAGNYRIKVHKTDGTFVRSIGSKGDAPSKFSSPPTCVASTVDNNLVVAEKNAWTLKIYTAEGDYMCTLIPTVPGAGNPIVISDIAVDRRGNIIVADTGNDQLIALGPAGQYSCTIAQGGTGPGQVRGPTGVTIRDGEIVVCDSGNRRLQVFQVNEEILDID